MFELSLMIFPLIIIATSIVDIVARWKMFTKAGESGWMAVIPFLSDFTFARIATETTWLQLTMLVAPIIATATSGFAASGIFSSLLGSTTSELSPFMSIDSLIPAETGLSIILVVVAECASVVARLIVNYKLAEAFDLDEAYGVALMAAEPIAILPIAFDRRITYVAPAD